MALGDGSVELLLFAAEGSLVELSPALIACSEKQSTVSYYYLTSE